MKHFLYLLAFICLSPPSYGQGNPEARKALAKELIAFSNYSEALTTLRNDRELRLRDKEARFLIAVCLYQLNRLDEAESLLVDQIDNEKAPYAECWLFLGKIFHARHQFAEAARYYKIYLRRISEEHPNRRMVLDEIQRCSNGLRLQYSENQVFVENLGPEINTPHDEFGAIPSPNHATRLYFSSRRPGNVGGARTPQGQTDQRYGAFYCDIYSAANEAGQWGNVRSLPHLLNSPQHEVILDFNQDGSVMYFFQGNNLYNGRVLLDTFRQNDERLLSSDPFLGPIETVFDQAAPHFVNATTVIFPSRRPGGYGGMDLYISAYSNGGWSAPRNLGPAINSSYDETTPFMALDGRTLYFSSNRSDKSIGGYDVFKSTFFAQHGLWTEAQNQGLPINSAADDTHFRLTNDGFSAFFTSSRKDGMGERDLYVAYYQNLLREQEPAANLAQTFLYPFSEPTASAETPIAATPSAPSARMEAPRSPEQGSQIFTFTTQIDIFKKENLQRLDLIAETLASDPQQNLVVAAVGKHQQGVSADTYQLVKDVAMIGEYLASKGVGRTRIRVVGELHELQSRGNPGEQEARFRLISSSTAATGQGSSGADDGPTLCYRVKVERSFGAPQGRQLIDQLPDIFVEKPLDEPFYFYFTGVFATYAEARAWCEEHREIQQSPNAEIVPFIRGWKVDKALADRYIDVFPDLGNYLAGSTKK